MAKLSLSTLAIRRHVGTLMITLAVVVVGIFFLFRLQVDLLPAITYPRIGVRVDAPGISPEVAIEEVTKPLESALSATEGLVQIFSETREGRIRVDLFFAPGGDIDQALTNATTTLNRARNRLPNFIEEPRLFKFDPSQLPVYELAVQSQSLPPEKLRLFAQQELSRELSIIPGVAGVDVAGGVTEEVTVNLNLQRLQAVGVSVDEVLDALRDRNQDVAGGRLRGEASEPLTRTVGRFQNVSEIRNLSLEIPGGDNAARRIYLRDVAEIVDGTEEQRVFVYLNGQPAVKVSIQKQPDANTLAVIAAVKAQINQLQKAGLIPDDMQLLPTLDESRFIRNAITNVASAGLIGTILAAMAVLLFLGSLRQTLIIVLAIPLATLTAIIFMKLFGLSINVFSLGGLALGVGIVVDNSIVMLENITARVIQDRKREKGERVKGKGEAQTVLESDRVRGKGERGRVEEITVLEKNIKDSLVGKSAQGVIIQKTEQSSREVESALVASTSTNLVAVLPFLLIGGLASLLFSELILTISFAVAASLLLALTVVPMLASRLLTISWSSGVGKLWLLRWFNSGFVIVTQIYYQLLIKIIRQRLLAIALAIIIFGGGSWWMLDKIPQEILPQINTGQVIFVARFPPGTNLATNQKVMSAAEQMLLSQPETEYAFTTVGGAIFASITVENTLRGTSNITLTPGSNLEAFVEKVSQEFDKLNLVDIRLRLFPGRVRGITLSNSPLRGADIDLILQGEDSQLLQTTGREVLQLLDDQVTLARFRPNGESRQPEIQIKPDWERLATLGLTTEDIGDTLATAIRGSVPTRLQRGQRLVDVRVQLTDKNRQTATKLAQLPLFVDNNRPIRLGEVATITPGIAPGEIQRINQRQVFLIAGNLSEGASLSAALAEVEEVLATVDLPRGIRLLPSYAARSNQQLQTALQVLGGLAAFLVFVVMAVQYNSLIDPLVIMFTVPLALAGGVFGLYITQTAIGATVLVGAVLLVGIVVNNAIVMVELANQLRHKHFISYQSAILQAAPQRLRPILMTTITTVLGLFPLALGVGEGSEFLQPLGVVVFSGLLLATVLTLFIIPCFYVLLHDWLGKR